MASLFEGNCNGRAVNVEFGADGNNKPRVRWEMEVSDGPHAGKRARYSGKLDPENIKYTKRDMMLIGWKGRDVRTFVDDVKTANKVVPFVAEIARFDRDGKVNEWTSVKFSGSAKPLNELDRDKIESVNRWFAEVPDESGHSNAPGKDEDLPF